jgi:hypothetical protein
MLAATTPRLARKLAGALVLAMAAVLPVLLFMRNDPADLGLAPLGRAR